MSNFWQTFFAVWLIGSVINLGMVIGFSKETRKDLPFMFYVCFLAASWILIGMYIGDIGEDEK